MFHGEHVWGRVGVAAMLAVALTGMVEASSVTFEGSQGNLAAQAVFTVVGDRLHPLPVPVSPRRCCCRPSVLP